VTFVDPKLGFKTTIIIIFILTLNWINSGWPSRPIIWFFSWVDPQARFQNYNNKYFYSYVDLSSPGLKLRLVTQTLLLVEPHVEFSNYDNKHFYFYIDPPSLQPELCPGLTNESVFETIIITIYILTLTRVNSQLDSWTRPYTGSTPELGFKTIIITTFILVLARINWVNPLDL
jgi:hypothetical protein